MTSHLQLAWYWPGLAFTVKRLIKSREVCQVAKQGGTKVAGRKQGLYPGKPWQKVAVDLVVPFVASSQRNK